MKTCMLLFRAVETQTWSEMKEKYYPDAVPGSVRHHST